MGNNHEKFFSKEKRKLLILGLTGVGKSTLIKTLNQGNYQDKKEDLQIIDIKLKNITLCAFDMGGSERQRIFWRQNFYGSQGVIYVMDGNIDIVRSILNLVFLYIIIYLNKYYKLYHKISFNFIQKLLKIEIIYSEINQYYFLKYQYLKGIIGIRKNCD